MRPNTDVWTLKFNLTEYTPSEAERMTGVSQASQRDWRRHGYLPRTEGKHTRFNVFTAAELYIMKMFSDQGKGPQVSYSYAPKIALSMIKTAMIWRRDVWGDCDPVAIFDAIPQKARRLTTEEEFYESPAAQTLKHRFPPPEPTEYEKKEWIVDSLLMSIGVRSRIPHSRQAIWWPTGEVEIADYTPERFTVATEGALDRIDPKFDGPAIVLHLEASAANLARRSRLPFVAASLALNAAVEINRPDLHADHGTVIVSVAR